MDANAFENLSKLVETLRSRLDNRTREHNNLKHCFDELKSQYEKSKNNCVIGDNNREQYSRNWCLRVYGVIVKQSDIDELGLDIACMVAVYNRILRPILAKASKKVLPEIPPWYILLENGHFIGKAVKSKSNGNVYLPRPIIIRFSMRWQRNLFLKLKKKYMPSPTDAERVQGVEFFSASPDLTKLNYSVKKEVSKDKRVDKVWSLDGRLKFTLVNDTFVYSVECVLDSVEEIITLGYKQKVKSKQAYSGPARAAPKARLHVAQPLGLPVVQPMVQTVDEPAVQPVVEPVVQAVDEPAVQPVVGPVVQAVDQPVVQPSVQPVVQTTAQPAEKPVVQPSCSS